ncbi:MAG: hypothetical protein E6J72_21135 [Deltaproteobacteria bacterium]|nr:MAG: hypothetical protein E6J72_21135 [Deltaproteobacteria bacterium]
MRRGARRLPALVVGTIGLIGCAGLVLLLTYRHTLRIDLTPERTYTLSPHAQRILGGLDREVRVTAFVRSADPRTPFLKDLLWRVVNASRRVHYDFVDLNRSPALARQYGIERYGALVVESDGHRRDISNPSEGTLVSAVLAVTRPSQRVAYFLTGHGEHAPTDSDRKLGCSSAARALEEDLFVVRELPLVGPDGVPADATAVVVAGPRKDLLPDEAKRLDAYLDRGGALLLLVDPESPPSFAAIAARRGITPLDAVVVDPERRLAAGEGVTILVSGLTSSFLVSGTLEAPPVFSRARPLELATGSSPTAIGFLQSGAASYAVPAGQPLDAATGPGRAQVVGAAVVLPTRDGAKPGRLIVFGDADFATNAFVDYLGNRDLLVNSVNWLAREESLIAARAQQKEAGREQFFVTETQGRMAFWLAAVAQPAIFFAFAIYVFVRRRLA